MKYACIYTPSVITAVTTTKQPLRRIPLKTTQIDTAFTDIPSALVIGVGGSGTDIVRRIPELAENQLATLAYDPANQRTLNFSTPRLNGTSFSSWVSSTSSSDTATEAETVERLAPILDTFDIVFITAGLGGGSGLEAAPTISRLVRRSGRFAVGVLTLPPLEDRSSLVNVALGLNEMRKACHTLILFCPTDDYPLIPGIRTNPDNSLNARVADVIAGLSELISPRSYLGIEIEELRDFLTRGHIALMTSGQSTSSFRAQEATTSAVEKCLSWADLSEAKGGLMHIQSNCQASIGEVDVAMSAVYDVFPKDIQLLWGVTLNDARKDFQVNFMVSGVDTSRILGRYVKLADEIDDLEPDELGGKVDLDLNLDQIEN